MYGSSARAGTFGDAMQSWARVLLRARQIFGIGDFLVSIITFIIVALVIFLIVKVTKKGGIE
jgi:large-conductance mechanosensitive channel